MTAELTALLAHLRWLSETVRQPSISVRVAGAEGGGAFAIDRKVLVELLDILAAPTAAGRPGGRTS